MDDKWKGQSRQRGLHFLDLGGADQPGSGREERAHPDPNVFPTGEPHWLVRYPALIIPPMLLFGIVLYTLVTLWLSGW